MTGRLFVAAGASLGLLLGVFAGTASAQYPPPTGSCEAVTSATINVPGGSTELVVTVRDANGNVRPGAQVDVHIVQQPAGGATLDPASGVADANGQFKTKITLGSGTGTVQVSIDCGEVETRVSVVAGNEAPAPAPPNTGSGSTAGENGSQLQWTLMLVSGAAVLCMATGARIRRSRNR